MATLCETDDNHRVRSFYETRWGNKPEPPSSIHFGYTDPAAGPQDDQAAMERMKREVAQGVSVGDGDTVLDAGCAFGGTSVWLAAEHGCEVVGVDLVDEQLDAARAHAAARGVADRTRFQTADFLDTGLPAASFDVVWAMESVCHTADKLGFLREAARLLKPGGRLAVADFFMAEGPRGPRERTALGRFTRGWSIPGLVRPSEIHALARSVGLAGAQVRDISAHVLPTSRAMSREALRTGYPKNLVWSTLGLRPREEFINARSNVEQYRTLKRGLWLYGILTATKAA